jgi:hypothetical protein
MDPIEVQIDMGVFMFDRHVLEVFITASERFHARLLTATVSGPDRKGRRLLALAQTGTRSELPLDGAEFVALQPIFEALRGAGVNVVVERADT